MDPPPLPTTQPPLPEGDLEIPYAIADAEIRHADPLWLHRVFLGITGIVIAEALFVLKATVMLLGSISRSTAISFDFLWSRLSEGAFAIEWFSALYLLAAHEPIGAHDEARRRRGEEAASPRRLLLFIGGASVILRFLPLHFLGIRRSANPFVDTLFSLVYVAGISVLLLYILRLAQRTGDPFLRRHTPAAVMLLFINYGMDFAMSIRGTFAGANDVIQLFGLVANAYLFYVLLRMRRVFGDLIASMKSTLPSTESSHFLS
jgi:hypothetical protein